MGKVFLAFLFTVLAAVLLRFSFQSPEDDQVNGGDHQVPLDEIRSTVLRQGDAGTRTPSGCDILRLAFKMGPDTDASQSWTSATFSFCQLPAAWREAMEPNGVASEVEYDIPGRLVPPFVARLLGVSPYQDLRLVVRVGDIRDGPSGLRFPEEATSFKTRATELTDGSLVIWLEKGDGRYTADPKGAVAVHYSTWSADSTLVGTTRFGLSPSVVDLRSARWFWTELLTGAGEGDRVIVWAPASASPTGAPVTVDVSVIKVVR